ncbi:MAG TPA: Rrf2 family transcriptional regulator [Clostridia bacterium]|nr:Rrf2 family transcriptional regulator [Clostridia bacterium]
MMISTRGRYALRVMIDLAEHQNGSFIPMKDVAERQGISLKYIEKIMPVLSKHKMVESQHGKGGGYRLTSDPREYRVLDILKITEGNLAPVACLEKNAKPCSRIGECRTIGMWRKFHELTLNLFANITIADLMQKEELPDNYVI